MERSHHQCSKIKNFVNNFKKLYNSAHPVLFENPNLQFVITDEIQTEYCLVSFMNNIAQFDNEEELKLADTPKGKRAKDEDESP